MRRCGSTRAIFEWWRG